MSLAFWGCYKILDEGHNMPHYVYPSRNMLYKDLKRTFLWSNIKEEVLDYVTNCLTYYRAPKPYSSFTTLGNPWVEVGLSLHGLSSRLTTHPVEEQCDLGHRGSTHEDGSLLSHEKHMHLRPIGPSLPRGGSSIAWCSELYSVGPRY